jgi:hypothetical protein
MIIVLIYFSYSFKVFQISPIPVCAHSFGWCKIEYLEIVVKETFAPFL